MKFAINPQKTFYFVFVTPSPNDSQPVESTDQMVNQLEIPSENWKLAYIGHSRKSAEEVIDELWAQHLTIIIESGSWEGSKVAGRRAQLGGHLHMVN
jgi:hypothetical protein